MIIRGGRRMNDIISVEQLVKLQAEDEVTIIDVRGNLTKLDYGEKKYNEAHIPGAFFLDMEKDLSGEVKQHGGKHPLPDVMKLAGKLGEMGVHPKRKVVVYDNADMVFAARAWWVLRYIGQVEVMILEGGYEAWVTKGNKVTSQKPSAEKVDYTVTAAKDDIVSMEEVKNRDREKSILIDSRSFERYIGEVEPLYAKAGHIPGAKNYFWQDVLTDNQTMKDVSNLQNHFQALQDAEEIIVSCGSGVSACPNILALKRAGFKNVKLYPGSFSDWISYEENEVEQGEE